MSNIEKNMKDHIMVVYSEAMVTQQSSFLASIEAQPLEASKPFKDHALD